MIERLSPREIAALKQEILASLHCALPGIVESYDGEKKTAVIRTAVKGMPLLYDVPVFLASPAVNPGEACLVVFADRDMEAWMEGGEETKSGRLHSLSDGFAFVGWRTCNEHCDLV